VSTDTENNTPVTETGPSILDNILVDVLSDPLPIDELRQVDRIIRTWCLGPSEIRDQWCDQNGITPRTAKDWALGYMPAGKVDVSWLDRFGLETGDLTRAGLLAGRKLRPLEEKAEQDHKHALDTDDKDHRPKLRDFRWVLGGRIVWAVKTHKDVIQTWCGRYAHDGKTLAEVAGDYGQEEGDPAPTKDGKVPKYRTLSKNRSSRTVSGAKETDTLLVHLSPSLVRRCMGIHFEGDPEAESKFAKVADKVTPIWICEGHKDNVLTSQGRVDSLSLGGCEVSTKQMDEVAKICKPFAEHHVPMFLALDSDPGRRARNKELEMGAGQAGTCQFLAAMWARKPRLARHIRVVSLPQPDEDTKVDLADLLLEVYKKNSKPTDPALMEAWCDSIESATKVRLDELASSSVESIEFLFGQLELAVAKGLKPRDRSSALEECGLSAVAAHDPELWASGSASEPSIGERVAEMLGIEKRERKAWVKSVMKGAAEEAERLEKSSDDDPLARYVNKDGTIRPCWMSCLEILRKEFETSLKWDEMSLTVVLESVTGNGKKIRQKFDKKHFAKARSMLAKRYGCDAKKIDLEDAIGDLAIEQEVHPVQEWLRSLSKWDEKDRLPALMAALGVTVGRGYAPEKVALYTTYMRKTLIAAVARAMEPGCQVDTMLVLQGDQGIKKSTFFKALVPDIAWYGGAGRLDPDAKDSIMGLRKKWILEVAEVDRKSFFSSAAEWKDLITTQVDSLRPPYMRDVEDYPRTSLFMGSTNAEQFLTDPTGARRFWVVPLNLKKLKGEDIDKAAIIKMREQLWVQAYMAYKTWNERGRPEAECPWWLDLEEERAHAVDIKRHKVEDLDSDRLRAYLNHQLQARTVLGTEICKALDWQPSKYGKRIKEWMGELGWTSAGTRDGTSYSAPDDWRPGAGGLGVLPGGVDMAVIAAISDDG
jgi:predicted P-loop ATPase